MNHIAFIRLNKIGLELTKCTLSITVMYKDIRRLCDSSTVLLLLYVSKETLIPLVVGLMMCVKVVGDDIP